MSLHFFLYVGIYQVQLFNDAFTYYSAVIDNWRSDIMLYLRISQKVCAKNEQQLSLYPWPGSYRACDCRHINKRAIGYYWDDYVPEKDLNVGHQCNSTDYHYGCYQIPGSYSKKFKYFSDDYGNQFAFCAQFSKGDNFYKQTSNCQEGILCGTSKEYQFCSKSGVCPIYDFGFGDPPEEAIEQENGFWITRQSDENLPIANIRVGEGEGMCANPQLLPITKGRKDYILMEKSKVDCLRDDRFIKKLSTTETKFYKANDMLQTIQRFKIMEIDDKYEWNLYKMPYISWKSECRDKELQQFLFIDLKQKSIKIIWIFMILIIIIVITLYLLSVCFQSDNIFKSDWIMYEKNDELYQIKLFKAENTIKLIYNLLMIALICIALLLARNIQDLILIYTSNECSDKFTNLLLLSLVQKLEPGYSAHGFVVLFALQLIVDIILFFIFLINLRLHRDINQYQQINQQANHRQ